MTTMISRKRFEDKPYSPTMWIKDVLGFCFGMGGIVGLWFFIWIITNGERCGDFLC